MVSSDRNPFVCVLKERPERAPIWLLPIVMLLATTMLLATGCSEGGVSVREVQAKRQQRVENQTIQDHLGEVHRFLTTYVELDEKQAKRQIVYHLNRWLSDQAKKDTKSTTAIADLVDTYGRWLDEESQTERIGSPTFVSSDVEHLRDSYLMRQIVQWVDTPQFDDPLLVDWFVELETKIGAEQADKLRTASRLFDWLVRNIAPEPQVLTTRAPAAVPKFPTGITFRGAGYRQTDYQTIWRGQGDSLQLSGVFILLCRQAGIDAFLLGLPQQDDGQSRPWCLGVLVGEEIYLFEPQLGVPISLPQETSIATLTQARRDAAVLRRLKVSGFFDYPVEKSDIQQCVALLNVVPEAISERMKWLQAGLTGERRLISYVDVDQLAKRIDDCRGIAGARLWDVPLKAEIYAAEIAKAATRDAEFQTWYQWKRALLELPIPSSKGMAKARWTHLHGRFTSDEETGEKGARSAYQDLRSPEFEIEDLRIDVNLQKRYGVRRELGTSLEDYDRQISSIQAFMRRGKRTASYWISLVQYDAGLFEASKSWLIKRTLAEEQRSAWWEAAVYNHARVAERLGQYEEALESYRSEKNGRPHGSRIRARLLARKIDQQSETESADKE